MAMDLLKQPNDIILDALRYNASPQYQQRVPEATQAGVMKTIGAITRYTPAMNEFVNALVNQIGTLWVRNETWTNPLREFIQLDVEYGDTIAEVGMGLLRAHHLDLDCGFSTSRIDESSARWLLQWGLLWHGEDPDLPAVRMESGSGITADVGTDGGARPVLSGSDADLWAWLIGRATSDDLAGDPDVGSDLPAPSPRS